MTDRPALPLLETERLHLRWLTEDDAPLMLAIWNDPDFIRHVGDRGIRTLEEARAAMRDGVLKLYREQGMGPYGVFLHGFEEAMGICGLFKRDNLDYPDIGYGFLPAFCRNGYAVESARAVRDHAASHMKLPRLLAIVSPDHQRSIRLLEKLGMSETDRLRMPGDDDDVALYGMTLKNFSTPS